MKAMNKTEGAELAAYCGLYCGACAIKNGQIRDTAKTLQQMLEAYGYAQWAPTLAEFVPATKHYSQFEGVLEWLMAQDCEGCPAGGGNPACTVRICAREKGFAGCWECDDATCDKLQQEIGQSAPALENQQRIREVGPETWLAEQAAKVKEGFSYLDV
jgi:hypothetical protein